MHSSESHQFRYARAGCSAPKPMLAGLLFSGGGHCRTCLAGRLQQDRLRRLCERLTAAQFLFAIHDTFFFHEYGRRVGMVPRSSLKGGKVSRMVEKKTRTTNNKKTNRTQNQKGPQAASPPSCSLSSVLGETGETRKSVKKGLN